MTARLWQDLRLNFYAVQVPGYPLAFARIHRVNEMIYELYPQFVGNLMVICRKLIRILEQRVDE